MLNDGDDPEESGPLLESSDRHGTMVKHIEAREEVEEEEGYEEEEGECSKTKNPSRS